MTLDKGTNNVERLLSFRQITGANLGTNLTVENYATFELQSSSSVNERAHVIFESYCNSVIDPHGILRMKNNSLIELTGNSQMQWLPNAEIISTTGSGIRVMDDAILTNCSNDIIGPLAIYVEPPNATYRIINDCSLPLGGGGPFETLIDSGGSITVNNGAVMELGSGGTMIFDGTDSKLVLNSGSTVKLGTGASIEFRNGAHIEADGCTFTSLESGNIWNGLVLDGAGSESFIQNCTFENASTSISITNTVSSISGNTFYVPLSESNATAIEATNETNITIFANTIELGSNLTARGIYFFNYDGDGMPGGGGSSSYSLNIINNFINGGAFPITIDCLTSSQLPFLIKANQVTPASGISSYGIFAYNITGDIKLNNFVNINSSNALTLQQCNVNIYDNFLQSGNTSVNLHSYTTAQISPIQNEYGQWVWYGGMNGVTSDLAYCMDFGYGSNPIVSPRGTNCFTVNTQPNYHINGEYCQGFSYTVSDNYWSSIPPSFNVNCGLQQVSVNYTPYYSECPSSMGDIIGSQIDDIGGGLYDTVYVTAGGGEGGSFSGKTIVTGNSLYYQAITKRKQGDFAEAINKCKELINNYDTSKYFLSSVSELYRDYLESDTIRNQNITTGLFNNLKNLP